MQVGGVAVRWVLVQHAEPWFLTLHSKRAYCHPTWDEPKSQSSTRKRSRRGGAEETGRPAKRPAVDAGVAEQGETPQGDAAEEKEDEEELGNKEEDGGKLLELEEEEGGQQTQPEDAGGRKETHAADGRGKMEGVVREEEEEARSPSAALPGADEE